MKRVPIAILLLVLVAGLVFGFAGPNGVFLCIGTEGHPEIETNGAAYCAGPTTEERLGGCAPRETRAEAGPGQCEPCVGFPISRAEATALAKTNSRRVNSLQGQADSARPAPEALTEPARNECRPPLRTFVQFCCTLSLRRSVLLI